MLGPNLRSEPQMCVDRSPRRHEGLLVYLTRCFSDLTVARAKPRERAWHAGVLGALVGPAPGLTLFPDHSHRYCPARASCPGSWPLTHL